MAQIDPLVGVSIACFSTSTIRHTPLIHRQGKIKTLVDPDKCRKKRLDDLLKTGGGLGNLNSIDFKNKKVLGGFVITLR
jgi:hypothetical protein